MTQQTEFYLSNEDWNKLIKRYVIDPLQPTDHHVIGLSNYFFKFFFTSLEKSDNILKKASPETQQKFNSYFKKHDKEFETIAKKANYKNEHEQMLWLPPFCLEYSQLLSTTNIFELDLLSMFSLFGKLSKDSISVCQELKKRGLLLEDYLNRCFDKLDLNSLYIHSSRAYEGAWFEIHKAIKVQPDNQRSLKIINETHLSPLTLDYLKAKTSYLNQMEANVETFEYVKKILLSNPPAPQLILLNKHLKRYSQEYLQQVEHIFEDKTNIQISIVETQLTQLTCDRTSLVVSQKFKATDADKFLSDWGTALITFVNH